MRTTARLPLKIVVAIVLVMAACVRVALFSDLRARLDHTFFLVLGAAALVLLIPWERLTGFKAAGVEVTLELPQVAGAIQGLGLDRVSDQKLRQELRRLESEIAEIGGSRILWIDDEPRRVVALWRLLRALGVETVMAGSTDQADMVVAADNDFDLIVSDVQRRKKEEQVTFAWVRESESTRIRTDRFGEISTTGGRHFHKLHEGVNYIVRLRTEEGRDPVVRALPVLFYAAYDWARLPQYAAVAMATSAALRSPILL